MTQFKRSEVSLLVKARSRMLNLKHNFKGQFRGDVSCPRCDLGTDDENHVFTSCVKLKNLHGKYEIHGFQDVSENINLVLSGFPFAYYIFYFIGIQINIVIE